ncbi:MAG TPA: hypothetical protein VMW52_05325 [Phycisphaerae bacterium]|nr:hypothetical protein [Phycisphaerae bacterium]
MKILTVCQPHAHRIADGVKPIENRPWYTFYRGPLAIHAGLSRGWLTIGDELAYPDMAFGAIVAVANLIHCLPINIVRRGRPPDDLAWVRTHPDATGPYCWVLSDVFRLPEPIPWRGRQGLQNVPDDLFPCLPEEFRAHV